MRVRLEKEYNSVEKIGEKRMEFKCDHGVVRISKNVKDVPGCVSLRCAM